MIGAVPYTTFPIIEVGPLSLRTFGVAVAAGIALGAMVAARYAERHGVARDEVLSLSTKLVIAGLIGARITWVLTHLDQIDSPVDVVAVWKGGLQFSGGFIAAVLVALPVFRRWDRVQKWHVLDGLGLGLALGLAFGRVGCYAVGEHLGGPTSFFLGTRYDGGDTREGPPAVGQVIHNTSLYEFLHLVVLVAFLWWVLVLWNRPVVPGTGIGFFVLWYGVARFATDFLRAYDETTLGLTGAQWLCVALVPAGLWILARRPARERALAVVAVE